MSYYLRRTDGTTLNTILDGTIDNSSSTSLIFVGKNYSPYGQIMADNFIQLLEHFSNTTPPIHPLSGQMWYDRSSATMKVYTGTAWKSIGQEKSSSQPTQQTIGDTWFDSSKDQLFVKTSSGNYSLVGPIGLTGFTNTTITGEIITDTTPFHVKHNVLSVFVENIRMYVLHSGEHFESGIDGFQDIWPGLNANTSIDSNFIGTVSNAEHLGGIAAAQYFRLDHDVSTASNIQIANSSSLASVIVGDTNKVLLHRDAFTNYGVLENPVIGGGWKIQGTVSGSGTVDIATFQAKNGLLNNSVGIFNSSPITTLDVGGSLKTKYVALNTTPSVIACDCLAAGTYELNLLSASKTINLTNFSTPGQSIRLVVFNPENVSIWKVNNTEYQIMWPNDIDTPNFTAGPNNTVVINFFRLSESINGYPVIATYVTY